MMFPGKGFPLRPRRGSILTMASFVDFVIAFQRAIKASQLYSSDHPRHMESLTEFEVAYGQFLLWRNQVQVAARYGRIFVDGQIEDEDNHQLRALAKGLEERSIHALVLFHGVDLHDLEALLAILCLKPPALRALGGARKYLEDHGVTRIQVTATRLEEVSEAGEVISTTLPGAMTRYGEQAPSSGDGSPGSPSGLPLPKEHAGGAGEGGGESGQGKGHPPGTPSSGQGSPGGHLSTLMGRAQTLLGGLTGSGSAAEGAEREPGLPRSVMGSGRGSGQDLSSVVGQVQAFLGTLTAGGLAAADLSGLGDYLEGMGLDRQGHQPGTQGVISRAVSSLPPLEQLGVLMGSGALRSGQLRNVFSRLSTTLAARTMASAVSTGEMTTEQFMEAADHMKAIMPSTPSWVEQITEALRHEGMSEAQLKALLDILTWESRPLEERIKALLEGQRIFEMPAEKVLAFLRELLEAGRNTEFLRLLRHFATGLQVPAVARRLTVAQSFEKIADWVDIPGMSPHIMEELMGILSRAYGREKDPEVHRWLSLGVEHILWFFMESRDSLRTCSLLENLQDVVTELSLPVEWKEQATVELLQRLGTPERLDKILSQLHRLEPQDAMAQVHPLFAMLGPSAASYLVERLSQESDRNRRKHIMDALKTCGHIAEAPLLESLKSSEWFVVRNALIVLGEVASPERVHELAPFLDHKDARVRLAAVRALGHLGGRDAEATLARLLSRPDPELQLEVLFILDELKVRNAIPALMDLLKAGKTRSRSRQDKVREKAVEVLGHLGSHAVIPVLAKLLTRQKGFFRDTREALPIRIEALRALHSLGSVESREAIKKALASEPAGTELEALRCAELVQVHEGSKPPMDTTPFAGG